MSDEKQVNPLAPWLGEQPTRVEIPDEDPSKTPTPTKAAPLNPLSVAAARLSIVGSRLKK